LGERVGDKLLKRGGEAILREVYGENEAPVPQQP
jgi:hypothetical protein